MRSVGLMEIVVMWGMAIAFYGSLVAAAVWALFTLRRISAAQELMQHKLEAIEQALQRRS